MRDEFHLAGGGIEGRYDVERLVTAGGFGTVYFGRHRALRTPVAVKVLRLAPDLSPEEHREFTARFLAEAQTLVMLQHPAVVRALDFGVSPMPNGQVAPWMALEWVEGSTLKALLEGRRGAPMSPPEALALLRPVLEAIAEAHARGVVHRDIKPANIMAPQQPGALPTRVLDFGIAKVMRPEERAAPTGNTATSSMVSAFSARYAAPEQIGAARTGPWTDVHALGLVLTEMLTGRRAYQGDEFVDIAASALSPQRPTPASRGVDVGAWEPVLARALAFKPADRFADAGALLAALDAGVAARPSPRRPWVAVTAATAVALLSAAAVGIWFARDRPSAARAQGPASTGVDRARTRCRPPGAGAVLTGAAQVTAGGGHTCARLRDGTVRCWGTNRDGELGDGTLDDRASPVVTAGLADVVQVAAGAAITCALRADGTAACWGRGIVPGSEEIQNRRPVTIAGVRGGVQITAGLMHACARGVDGAAWCWGQDDKGQLGDGGEEAVSGPVRVVGLRGGVAQLAAGGDHTCALLTDGTVWCWGDDAEGALGDGVRTRARRATPAMVLGVRDAVQVTAGAGYHCARLRDGRVACWGSNRDGQLGVDDARGAPTLVPGVAGAVDVVTGDAHACARSADGALRCWGSNAFCEMGSGELTRRRAPALMTGLPPSVELTAGASHTCARSADGAVRCWGWNRDGQLGDGAPREQPDVERP